MIDQFETVSEAKFRQTVRALNAAPDGFRINGAWVQSLFKTADGSVVARVSSDSRGYVYEILSPLSTRDPDHGNCNQTP